MNRIKDKPTVEPVDLSESDDYSAVDGPGGVRKLNIPSYVDFYLSQYLNSYLPDPPSPIIPNSYQVSGVRTGGSQYSPQIKTANHTLLTELDASNAVLEFKIFLSPFAGTSPAFSRSRGDRCTVKCDFSVPTDGINLFFTNESGSSILPSDEFYTSSLGVNFTASGSVFVTNAKTKKATFNFVFDDGYTNYPTVVDPFWVYVDSNTVETP